MQISVKIFANLVENEEDFYAQLPPSLRGYQTPTDESEVLCRGNYDPREFQKFIREINLKSRLKKREEEEVAARAAQQEL